MLGTVMIGLLRGILGVSNMAHVRVDHLTAFFREMRSKPLRAV